MNTEQYGRSIASLINLAKNETTASRAAAQVLLSAYNGISWQLDITDLCLLDDTHYQDAINVIRGRVELSIEPHKLINNGHEIFTDLWRRWERYHMNNRYKDTCMHCRGQGVLNDEICFMCGGSGLEEPIR